MKIQNKVGIFAYKYVRITLASLLYAIAMALFLDPLNLAPGGFSGISIILNRFVHIGIGTWFMILNVPVLILAVWKFGMQLTVSTIYSTVMTSLFTNLVAQYFGVYASTDMILGIVFGSLLVAVAMGVTFLSGATTGGSDIIVKVLREKFPHIKTGRIFLIQDVLVIICAGIALQDIKVTLYSLISVWIMDSLLDVVLYGRDGAKLIYIISDKPQAIADRVLAELDIGATFLTGKGAYTGSDKNVIMCVTRKDVYPRAEQIVREEDPQAFLIVTSATEIFGEGYKSYFDERI